MGIRVLLGMIWNEITSSTKKKRIRVKTKLMKNSQFWHHIGTGNRLKAAALRSSQKFKIEF